MERLHGYSERGLVNALFESIAASDDPHERWKDLLRRMRLWIDARELEDCPRLPVRAPDLHKRKIKGLQIYVEPSLSDFGNPDAVVLVDYHDETYGGDAFFFEAKLETFASSVGIKGTALTHLKRMKVQQNPMDQKDVKALKVLKAMTKNSSSILHELFLKARFHKLHSPWKKRPVKGVKVYVNPDEKPRKEKLRKIGNDPMVLELAKALAKRTPYFVSLTTDPTLRVDPPLGIGDPWPDDFKKILWCMNEIDECNKGADKKIAKNEPYGNPFGGWVECSLQLGWDGVWSWAEDNQLLRMQITLWENRCKFALESIDSLEPQLRRDEASRFFEEFFKTACGFTIGDEVSGRTRLREKNVVATYQVLQGLDGTPWVSIYFSGGGSGIFTRAKIQALSEKGLSEKRQICLQDLQDEAAKVGWAS